MDYAYDGITGVSNPTGDYGVKQVIETTHTLKDGGGDVVIDEWSYRWDQMYNKTKRTNVRGGRNGPIYTYSYDDAYRLTHSQRQAGMTTSNTYYTLDGTNNRRLVYSVLSFPPPPDNYVLDDNDPPLDEQMNQYTQTPFDERVYDENGNLLTWTDGSTIDFEATYDYRNQMISVTDNAAETETAYRYDALGRRTERVVGSATTRYYYFGWRVVEEQSGDDETVATYVYGNYIDEPLQMRRDLGEGMEDYYYHQDDMYNVMALTDASGAVVERYDYKDYGEPIIYDANGQVISGTAYGNPYLFNGRRHDPETGFYYYRTRYLDPKVGRFTTRDTIGIWGDAANLGNAYAYVGNNPWSWLDPLGLECLYQSKNVKGKYGEVKSDPFINLSGLKSHGGHTLESAADDYEKNGGDDVIYLSCHGKQAQFQFAFDEDGAYLTMGLLRQLIAYNMDPESVCEADRPRLCKYTQILKTLFDNTEEEVVLGSCNTGAGRAGLEFLQALRDLMNDISPDATCSISAFDNFVSTGNGKPHPNPYYNRPNKVTVSGDPSEDPSPGNDPGSGSMMNVCWEAFLIMVDTTQPLGT